MAEATSYTGTVTSLRSTYQYLTTDAAFSTDIKWAAFTKTPFMKAIGLEAFGVDAVKDVNAMGKASASGRIIREVGGYAFGGAVFASAPSSSFKGRLGNFTPELVEGGDEYKYSLHRLAMSEFIPDVDVMDNESDQLISIKAQKMQGMKQQFVQDINYVILGNSSAPGYSSSQGPHAVYNDLPNMISVDQTRTVGAIEKTNAYWQNGYKAITSVGGGGEFDRPLTLRRGILKAKNDRRQYAETKDDYLQVCTQGMWQYIDRLMFGDGRLSGGAFTVNGQYDAAGIQHFAFAGSPLVWDPAVTVPYAASAVTAGTEALYGINIPDFAVAVHKKENFFASGWEEPREHDTTRIVVAGIRTRITPAVTGMRGHFVCYNIPACGD